MSQGKCPNISFFDESSIFRTGLFKVPVVMERIYVTNHISKTRNTFHTAGSSEIIKIKNSKKRIKCIIEGKYNISKLEQLIIYPIPTTSAYKLSTNPKKRHEEENDLVQDIVEQGLETKVYENIASTASIVVPKSEHDTIFQKNYQDYKKRFTLQNICNQLSEDNPKKVVTILVAACRTSGNNNIKGIPLMDYVNDYGFEESNHYLKLGNEKIYLNNISYAKFDQKVWKQKKYDV